MNLFFRSQELITVLPHSIAEFFLAERELIPAAERDARFEQLVFALLSEQEAIPVNLSDIKKAAKLLEEFEKDWNKPGRTVDEFTTQVFILLRFLSDFPEIKKIVSDICLANFFSGVVNLEKCLDFEKINEGQNNLISMSSRLDYIQLGLCFFEAQISPCWLLPPHKFFQKILSQPSRRSSEIHFSKLSSLLLLGECAFNLIQSYKALSDPCPKLCFKMQEILKRIRFNVVRILSHSASLEDEAAYLGIENECFLKTDDSALCAAYIIFTSTRVEGLKKSMVARFASLPEVFMQLQQAFGDTLDYSEGLDLGDLGEGLFDSVIKESDATSMKLAIRITKSLIDKGDFETLYNFHLEFKPMPLIMRKFILEEETEGSSLVNEMLAIFDKGKLTKGKSFLTPYYVNNASYISRIIDLIFPDIAQRVNLFAKFLGIGSVKNELVGNFITCELLLLSVFNDTHYFKDISISLQIFKKKIELNLDSVLEYPLVFINSFHILYFLAYKYSKFDSGLKKLLDDLNIVLDVLREGGKKFGDIRIKLVENKDGDFPCESLSVIERLVDKKLWDEDQAAELRHLEEIFSDEHKDSKKTTPPVGSRKKKKGAAASAHVAKGPESVMAAASFTMDIKKVVEPVAPELLPYIASSPLIRDISEPSEKLPIPSEIIAKIERFSELNRVVLAKLDAFREEIKLRLSQMSARGFSEQQELIYLDNCLEERQNTIRSLRGYFKKAKSHYQISFNIKPLIKAPFLLPELLEPNVSDYQESLSTLINLLPSIKEYQSSTISTHLNSLLEVINSLSIDIISLRQVRSFQYLLQFRMILSDIKAEFTPVLTRILNNENYYPLGELAVDAKNFSHLILQVLNASIVPFYMYELKDTLPFLFQIQRVAPETLNPIADLSAHLFHLIKKWNYEINRFAMALSEVIPAERESILITEMKNLLEKLSYSYFKNRNYFYMNQINRLFHPLAEVELFGSQLLMWDHCDIDIRLKWHNHQDSFDVVLEKIRQSLIREFGPNLGGSISARLRSLEHPNGSFVDVLKIKVPKGEFLPLSLDLSVFVGKDFPLISYVSHAAGMLDTRTGKIFYPHQFFFHVLRNILEIEEPLLPDYSERSKCSRLAHVLKLIIRVTYAELPSERLFLGESATKMFQEIISYKSDIAGLKKAKPHLVEALHFLLQQHFENFELTIAFFKRTAVILAFYQDLGCKLVAADGVRKLQFIAVDSRNFQLHCILLAESEKLPLAKDVSANSFLVVLPKDMLKCISPMLQVSTVSSGFFSQAAGAGTVVRVTSEEDKKVVKHALAM